MALEGVGGPWRSREVPKALQHHVVCLSKHVSVSFKFVCSLYNFPFLFGFVGLHLLYKETVRFRMNKSVCPKVLQGLEGTTSMYKWTAMYNANLKVESV